MVGREKKGKEREEKLLSKICIVSQKTVFLALCLQPPVTSFSFRVLISSKRWTYVLCREFTGRLESHYGYKTLVK